MAALAHAAGALARHPLAAHVRELARAVLVEMLLRVLGILKIVSLANTIGIGRILAIPFLGALVTTLVILLLIVARLAKNLRITLVCCLEPSVLSTCSKNIGQMQSTTTVLDGLQINDKEAISLFPKEPQSRDTIPDNLL